MSDFWKRKMRTYFRRIDFDNDNKITRLDFEGMAKRFREKVGSSPDADNLEKSVVGLWDAYFNSYAVDNAIVEDKFIEAMRSQLGNQDLEKTLLGPLPIFFKAVDANSDGMISQDEFKSFFEMFGLDSANADSSFQAIDANNDGLLSLDEFMDAGKSFFTGEDQASATKLFFGPMVE